MQTSARLSRTQSYQRACLSCSPINVQTPARLSRSPINVTLVVRGNMFDSPYRGRHRRHRRGRRRHHYHRHHRHHRRRRFDSER